MGRLTTKRLTGTDQATAEGDLHRQDKQCLPYRGTGSLLTLPLLGSRRDTWLIMSVKRQTACERQGWPPAQPIAHILV
jgi:hypothetical protein